MDTIEIEEEVALQVSSYVVINLVRKINLKLFSRETIKQSIFHEFQTKPEG